MVALERTLMSTNGRRGLDEGDPEDALVVVRDVERVVALVSVLVVTLVMWRLLRSRRRGS